MEQSELKRIGQILKDQRLQFGYTQEYAAEKSSISYSYYTKIERGEQLPSLEVACQLARTFRLSLDHWILGQSPDAVLSPAGPELLRFARELDSRSIELLQRLLQQVALLEK